MTAVRLSGSSVLKGIASDDASRKRSSTGDEVGRCHRKQAKSEVIRQMASPESPSLRDSSSDDGDADFEDGVSLPRYYLLNLHSC